jgi:hypothetical protein
MNNWNNTKTAQNIIDDLKYAADFIYKMNGTNYIEHIVKMKNGEIKKVIVDLNNNEKGNVNPEDIEEILI